MKKILKRLSAPFILLFLYFHYWNWKRVRNKRFIEISGTDGYQAGVAFFDATPQSFKDWIFLLHNLSQMKFKVKKIEPKIKKNAGQKRHRKSRRSASK